MRLGSALAAVVVAGAAASGCGLNQEGIAPPRDRIFYPGAIAIDPTAASMRHTGQPRWLYALNSNADLRFNDGTLVLIDLDKVQDVREAARYALDDQGDLILDTDGKSGPPTSPQQLCSDSKYFNPLDHPPTYCCWDALDRNVLNCDERQFINTDATVRLGSFGSALQFDTGQRLDPTDPAARN